MALQKAPPRSSNAALDKVTVYDREGKALEVTHLNGVELVRNKTHFWQKTDINNAHPEASGPADPTAKSITVYDEKGASFAASAANARDMVNSKKYFWNDPTGKTQEKALDAVVVAANALAAAEEKAAEDIASGEAVDPDAEGVVVAADTPTADVNIDLDSEPLGAQAERIAGTTIEKYLEGFSEAALREMAEKRYDEKIHHRSSKETIINRIVELEEEAQEAEAE